MNPKQLFPSFFIFCLLCLSYPTFAQKYQPMAIEGAHWIVQENHELSPFTDHMFSYTIKGDSIWQGKNYKKVYYESFYGEGMGIFPQPYQITHSTLYALVRDDIENQKVYGVFIFNDPEVDCPLHTDVLLYDFSLTKGELIYGCFLNILMHPFVPEPLIVDTVSVTNYEEEDRKFLHTVGTIPIYNLPVPEPLSLIEGIGIEGWGIFFYTFIAEPSSNSNGLVDYCVGADTDCGIITSIEENLYQQGFSIYPTLIDNHSFWVESNLPNFSLHVYDLMGREVANYLDINSSKQLVELGDSLGKGMYVVKVVDSQNQLIGTERIILH